MSGIRPFRKSAIPALWELFRELFLGGFFISHDKQGPRFGGAFCFWDKLKN